MFHEVQWDSTYGLRNDRLATNSIRIVIILKFLLGHLYLVSEIWTFQINKIPLVSQRVSISELQQGCDACMTVVQGQYEQQALRAWISQVSALLQCYNRFNCKHT